MQAAAMWYRVVRMIRIRAYLGMLVCILFLGPTGYAFAIDPEQITINGYTSFEVEKQIEKASDGGGDPNLSFDADLFDLVFNFRVADKVRAAADMSWEHGSASEDGRGNVALEYGFVEYTVSDQFKVRVGKMFIPFGIFNEIHTAKPAFLSVKEASSTNKAERIVDGAYRFFPRWGVGIALQGNGLIGGKEVDYDFFVSNGEQENSNPFEEDDNRAKAITARVRVELTGRLSMGSSFYFDRITEPGYTYLASHGIQIELIWETWRILAEGVQGFKKPDSGPAVKQIGWFIQPSYHFPNGLTPYVRFERADPDRSLGNDDGVSLVAGINYEISRSYMIKIENNYFRGASGSSLGVFPGSDYNEIKAAVVLGF